VGPDYDNMSDDSPYHSEPESDSDRASISLFHPRFPRALLLVKVTSTASKALSVYPVEKVQDPQDSPDVEHADSVSTHLSSSC
jgi:hypothetical protein